MAIGISLRKSFLLLGVTLLLLAATAPAWYFYRQYRAEQRRVQNPTEAAKEEARLILEKVGRLIMLPKDEEPTVATVTDRAKLAEQPFFAKAQNGDKLIVYVSARKAILYRPQTNIIIDVTSVTLGASPSAQTATGETTFDLRNGTTISGLTRKYETELKQKVATAVITVRGNATKQDYTTSLLVDNTPDGNREAADIAQALGLSLGKLPAGEATSSAQFTIIVGADKE